MNSAFISALKDVNFRFPSRKMAIFSAIFGGDQHEVFGFSPVGNASNTNGMATTVDFVLKVYWQKCIKCKRYALNLKENSW